jgi:hypothetical protein
VPRDHDGYRKNWKKYYPDPRDPRPHQRSRRWQYVLAGFLTVAVTLGVLWFVGWLLER